MVLELQPDKMMEVVEATAHETVYVDQFVDGVLDPNKPMLGPVRDGGHIIANTAPGCWGPMITPEIRGGHEVTQPVFVEGAEVGDAIVIRIKDITVTSMATASGNDQWNASPSERRFLFCAFFRPGPVSDRVRNDSVRGQPQPGDEYTKRRCLMENRKDKVSQKEPLR